MTASMADIVITMNVLMLRQLCDMHSCEAMRGRTAVRDRSHANKELECIWYDYSIVLTITNAKYTLPKVYRH